MRINRKLNLVIPVDTEKGTVYVHSMPISREVFEKHFLIIAKTFAAIYKQGLDVMSGPRVSMYMLKSIAEADGTWSVVQDELIAEIQRLTNVIASSQKGWQTIPYVDAVRTGIIDTDDAAEVSNAIVFFMCNSCIAKEDQLPPVHNGLTLLWGAEISSSDCTAYMNSLPISTETVNFTPMVPT